MPDHLNQYLLALLLLVPLALAYLALIAFWRYLGEVGERAEIKSQQRASFVDNFIPECADVAANELDQVQDRVCVQIDSIAVEIDAALAGVRA